MMDLGVQALPIVEPVLNEITDGLQKLVSLAGENPKEAAIAIKAIGAAAVAATGPVGMIVAGLYALKELYEKFQEWLSTGNDIQKSAISGEHEAVDALAYDIKTGGEKKGDVFTPFYQSARETLGEIFGTGERGRGATPLPVLMRTAEMRRKIFARKLSRI